MAIVITFLLTTALWIGLLAFALRRVVRHMQQNPDAVKALSEHVLVPLFGKKESGP